MRNISSKNQIEIGIKALRKTNIKLYKKIKPKIKNEFDKLGVKYIVCTVSLLEQVSISLILQ